MIFFSVINEETHIKNVVKSGHSHTGCSAEDLKSSQSVHRLGSFQSVPHIYTSSLSLQLSLSLNTYLSESTTEDHRLPCKEDAVLPGTF